MSEETKISVSSDELRLIAVLRAIKEFDKPHLISTDSASDALERLRVVVPEITELEKKHSGSELKLFLKGFVAGLASFNIREVPYELDLEDPEYLGGRSGGVRVGQGEDERLITQTGPQD